MVSLEAAYAACERLAHGHYENFPVASILVPRRMRRHVAAVYAFARAGDDFADEGRRSAEERYRLLDGWLRRLHAAAAAQTPGPPAAAGEPAESAEIFLALGATMRSKGLPQQLFEDLLSAFRQDVSITRYATWQELMDYCRRSANPVGRLVLRIADYRDARLDAQSDAICTALQLTNFWQDLRIDFERGRIYLPAEEWLTRGGREEALAASRLPSPWTQALAAAAARTQGLFEAGRPLCDVVRGRLRCELRATWLGGVRILDRLEAVAFDPLVRRPRLTVADAPWFAWRMATWPFDGGVTASSRRA